jgi:hypothetical protein
LFLRQTDVESEGPERFSTDEGDRAGTASTRRSGQTHYLEGDLLAANIAVEKSATAIGIAPSAPLPERP